MPHRTSHITHHTSHNIPPPPYPATPTQTANRQKERMHVK